MVALWAVQPDLLGGELAVIGADLHVVAAEDNIEVLAAGDVLAGETQASGDERGEGDPSRDQH